MAQLLLGTGYGHLYENPAALMLHVTPPSLLISGLVALGVPTDAIVPLAERSNPFYNGLYNVFTDDIGYAGAQHHVHTTCPSHCRFAHAPQSFCAASQGCYPPARCDSA